MNLSTCDIVIFKGKIQSYYRQFREFTLGIDMPLLANRNILIVNFKNNIGEPVAQIISPTKRNGMFTLKIDYSLYFMNHILKSILFHEFTHILDYSSLLHKCDDQELLIKLYSEYHASQFQMMALLEFKTYSQDSLLSLNDIIYDVNKQVTIYQFLSDKRNEIIDILNNSNLYDKDELRKNTYNLLYYLGWISVVKIHCPEELGVFLDISTFIEKYGNELKKIVDDLEIYDIEYNTDEIRILLLKNIATNYLVIMSKFSM